MKTKTITLFLSLTLLGNVFPLPYANADSPLQAEAGQPAQQGSVMFVENMGQFDARARFQAQVGLGVLWLADDALWLTVAESPPLKGPEGAPAERDDRLYEAKARQAVNLKLSFPNANPRPRLESFDRHETVSHYYRGSDPSRWQTNVPAWGGVRYVDLYPGIDLEVSGAHGQWNWRLVCKENCQPFGDFQTKFALQDVRLQIEGSETVAVKDGFLQLNTDVGNLALPLLTVEGVTLAALPATAHVTDNVFEISHPFSAADTAENRPLQADYSEAAYFGTYLGGSDSDQAYGIAVDGTGDIIDSNRQRAIYVTGVTMSNDFPTVPGGTTLSGVADVFVTRLKRVATLVRPAFSAYIGGAVQEAGQDIVVDKDGSIYVTGWTTSSDFPTTANAFDQTHNVCSNCSQCNSQADAFVIKMDNSGGLTYATYLGGSYYYTPGQGNSCGYDDGFALAVDAQGIVYVTGKTRSQDFPTTPGAHDTVFSNIDIGLNEDTFVVKLDLTAGSNGLLYGTYIGGGTHSRGVDLAIDEDGKVYVVGVSEPDLWGRHYFPTTSGAYSVGIDRGGGDEVILFKMNPAGNGSADLLYSTFLGKEDTDQGEGIALDTANQVYIIGKTYSPDFPTTSGAFDTSCGTDGNCNNRTDLFVSKFNLGGNGSADLLYSTFLGGNYYENFTGSSRIALDTNGDVYVTGDTGSDQGFPITPDAYDATPDTSWGQAFVTRMRLQGKGAKDVIYSTYLGGSGNEGGAALALDEDNRVYVVGTTESTDFPTTQHAFDRVFSGDDDVFVIRLLTPPAPDLSNSTKSVSPNKAAIGQVVTFTVQLVNSGSISATVAFTDTLPAALLLQGSPTASSGNAPGVQGQTITWSGTVTEDTSVVIRYAALLTSTNGTAILPVVNEALIDDGRGNIYTRRAFVNAYKVFLPIVLK